jgi:hypothetical protein
VSPRKTHPLCTRCRTALRNLEHDGRRHAHCPRFARLALVLKLRRRPCSACGRTALLSRAGGYLVCSGCRPHMASRGTR